MRLDQHPAWAAASAEACARAPRHAARVHRVGRLDVDRLLAWSHGPDHDHAPGGDWLDADAVLQLARLRRTYDRQRRLFGPRRPTWRATLRRLDDLAMVNSDRRLALALLFVRDADRPLPGGDAWQDAAVSTMHLIDALLRSLRRGLAVIEQEPGPAPAVGALYARHAAHVFGLGRAVARELERRAVRAKGAASPGLAAVARELLAATQTTPAPR